MAYRKNDHGSDGTGHHDKDGAAEKGYQGHLLLETNIGSPHKLLPQENVVRHPKKQKGLRSKNIATMHACIQVLGGTHR